MKLSETNRNLQTLLVNLQDRIAICIKEGEMNALITNIQCDFILNWRITGSIETGNFSTHYLLAGAHLIPTQPTAFWVVDK